VNHKRRVLATFNNAVFVVLERNIGVLVEDILRNTWRSRGCIRKINDNSETKESSNSSRGPKKDLQA
jgi:hypothetical protein